MSTRAHTAPIRGRPQLRTIVVIRKVTISGEAGFGGRTRLPRRSPLSSGNGASVSTRSCQVGPEQCARFVVPSAFVTPVAPSVSAPDRQYVATAIRVSVWVCEGLVTKIAVDIVDAYVFRRHNGMVQFLLLQREREVPLGGTWHAIHGKIDPNETALESAKRAVHSSTGLRVTSAYSADYVNQFFDPDTDSIILAPVFAFTAPLNARVTLSEEFSDFAWVETEEATARLLFSGQRWAVRHIEEIIGLAGDEAEYYRIQ